MCSFVTQPEKKFNKQLWVFKNTNGKVAISLCIGPRPGEYYWISKYDNI